MTNTKTLNELCAEILDKIGKAETLAKNYAGEHFSVVLSSDGTVYDGSGLVWDKNTDTELFWAYRDPRGIEENDLGIDKDYAFLFAIHSEVSSTGILLSGGKTDYCIAHYVNAEKNIDRFECEIV